MSNFRYSIAQLFALTIACCIIFAAVRWNPFAAILVTPGLVGPFAAHFTHSSRTSLVLGFFGAYYWSLALAVIALIAASFLRYADIDIQTTLFVTTVLSGVLGGYLSARVERSRVDHRTRRREHRPSTPPDAGTPDS